MTRKNKKIISAAVDFLLIGLSLWLSLSLRLSELWTWRHETAEVLFVITPVLGVLLFYVLGLYNEVIREAGHRMLFIITIASLLLSLLIYLFVFLIGVEGFPRSAPIIFFISNALFITGSREFLKFIALRKRLKINAKNVLIYGDDDEAIKIMRIASQLQSLNIVGFIQSGLHGHHKARINGIRIYSLSSVKLILVKRKIDFIVVDLDKVSLSSKADLLDIASAFKIRLKTILSPDDWWESSKSSQLRNITIDDLLGRDSIVSEGKNIRNAIKNYNVCITGAGGSIGSEIARQCVTFGAKNIILIDHSEFAIYKIEQELSKNLSSNQVLIPVLLNVLDTVAVERVLKHYSVDIVYHAAAYKHVPMVEANPVYGILNNVFGTKSVADAANNSDVKKFVLISTDKAVRPTNVMGATKRLAELYIQAIQNKFVKKSITFTMVRFGNVLGSSGSVVPLFNKQIQEGGPLTVTDKRITRYFMTIVEAAGLVIQAGSYAKGGDVFLLHMGELVLIDDLAKKMIQLSGKTIKSVESPEGEIEIIYTGLRPGEKLYEELLVDDKSFPTDHPKIFTANENFIDLEVLNPLVDKLRDALEQNHIDDALGVLCLLVEGFECKPLKKV